MRLCTVAVALAFLGSSTLALADDETSDDAGNEDTAEQPARTDAGDADAGDQADDEPKKKPTKAKKKKKKKKKKAKKEQAAPEEAAVTESAPGARLSEDRQPPRITFAGELLGAAPIDQGNRDSFSTGGGGSLGGDVYIAPMLGLHVGVTMLLLGKNAAMSSTTWVAAQAGPRVHVGTKLFGDDTKHDAWVDAHVLYGSSGGIRRPGFDVGAAVQWEVSPAIRIGPMLRYQFGSDPRSSNAQLFTIGLAVGFGGRTRVPVHVDGDQDGDGIADSADACPDQAPGEHPDREREGCPSPDTDGDGVFDAKDLCPEDAVGDRPDPSRVGCPFTDKDDDNIVDADDKCPTIAGPPNPFEPASHGCPKLARVVANKIEILEQIFFETDSATIKPESVPVLEAIAGVLKTLSGAKVRVEGHTDVQGTDAYNLELSKRRARSVAQWLIQNAGIDAAQLSTEGYGKSRPIVSGPDADVSLNRRVEFVILDSP